jgi:putative ABC transport system ATP-binding protein
MNNALLDISHVSLKIPGVEKPILSNINYHVHESDFVIILGSNGSGKSSLLKLLDRRYEATSGHVFLSRKSVHEYSAREFSQAVVTLTQNSHESLFGSLTILENYLLMKQRHEPQIFSVSHKQERKFFAEYLLEFNENLSVKLDQVVDRLSGGERQALTLALSVLYPPSILLMDEHTSALDPKAAQQLMALTQRVVSDHRITCLLTTHDLDIALEYGNRILALKQGEVFHSIEHDKKVGLSQQDLLAVCY